MKRKIMILLTVLSVCSLVACGGEAKDDANAGGNGGNESVATEAPTGEAEVTPSPAEDSGLEAEPTTEPVAEATPAPTEKPPVVYEEIDIESDLPIQTWIETFVGVIDEPKVVIFNNETGKKVIVEQEEDIIINPETDALLLYFPEGYKDGNARSGIALTDEGINGGFYEIHYFDSAEMREAKEATAGFKVMKGEEKIVLIFNWKVEE